MPSPLVRDDVFLTEVAQIGKASVTGAEDAAAIGPRNVQVPPPASVYRMIRIAAKAAPLLRAIYWLKLTWFIVVPLVRVLAVQ